MGTSKTNPICCKKQLENGIPPKLESVYSLLARETIPCMECCCVGFWTGLGACVKTTCKCIYHCGTNCVGNTFKKVITCPSKFSNCCTEVCEEGCCQCLPRCCAMCERRRDQETG